MKKSVCLFAMAALAVSVFAAPKQGPRGASGGAPVAKGRDAKVSIEQMAKVGGMALVPTPRFQVAVQGGMQEVNHKPRRWGLFEVKYATYAKWQDELTFNWYVLLDYTNASDKDNQNPPSKYSFYTVQTTYLDIKKGSHLASVVLPPSQIERYGEPVCITVQIVNKEGDILAEQSEGQEAAGLPKGNWWESENVMDKTDKKTGKPLVERRQGLVERQKTPFAYVNVGDWESVQ